MLGGQERKHEESRGKCPGEPGTHGRVGVPLGSTGLRALATTAAAAAKTQQQQCGQTKKSTGAEEQQQWASWWKTEGCQGMYVCLLAGSFLLHLAQLHGGEKEEE